ncbi:MAG: DUF72 domain-containing protein [Chloroflexota bacterium]
MGKVLVGTCSWTDKELIGSGTFYPTPSLSAEERLRFYAEQFPLVEVDSTYYALPNERTAWLWSERTPPEFTFDVKAFRLFTGHWAEPSAFPKDLQQEVGQSPEGKRGFYYRDVPEPVQNELWGRFRSALEPLRAAGKLGLVLMQYPTWITPGKQAQDLILKGKEMLPGDLLAVEFRHHAWLDEKHREDTLRFLRDNDLTFVSVDEPQGFTSSVPPLAEATSDVAYVRFHGRNQATWELKGQASAARFDWYYTPEEMAEWVPKIAALQSQTTAVHALMNTNRGDQGPVNARLLANLLQLPLGGAQPD